MAKPLGPKSTLIRDAITAHPDMGNTELAEIINNSPARKEDRIEVKAADIAAQKQVLKKTGTAPAPATAEKAATVRRGPRKAAAAPVAPATPATPVSPGSPVDLIDGVLALARRCGGFAELKLLVDRLAEMQG